MTLVSALMVASADCEGDCSELNPILPDRNDLPLGALLIAAVFLAVLVFGLRAIKRQRDDGRRSKFPPIG